MKTKSPLKWQGGKYYLADWLISLMPPHVHYVETHFGGGQVLFAKDPHGVSEVANDIDGELMNFWRVLQDKKTFSEFKRRMDVTPFSDGEFRSSELKKESMVGRAVAFFIRCRQSRAGNMIQFATLTKRRTRRGMNPEASSWLGAIDGLLDAVNRMKRVVVVSVDAIDLIGGEDTSNTLFYLDPPYLHETRGGRKYYRFEMSDGEHEDLLRSLSSICGKFILSGYRSDMYEDYARAHCWRRSEFRVANHCAAGSTKKIMTECAWTNYDPVSLSVGQSKEAIGNEV